MKFGSQNNPIPFILTTNISTTLFDLLKESNDLYNSFWNHL